MKPTNLLLGLAPWVLFSVAGQVFGADDVVYGTAIAFLLSLALLVRNGRRGSIGVIEAAGLVTFAVLTVLALTGSHAVRADLVHYGRGGCALVLAAVMAVSAYTVPFTEHFARQQVDQRYWGSPVFRMMNRRISLVWAGLIAVMACSHLVAGALAASGNGRPILTIALNWGVPVFVVIRGLKATEHIASQQSVSVAGGVA